ncbi:MAG TPA: AraC family transcriptional regulator [Candidatus Polarisedimenticolaceae bacterium]|nr:AraC family transcriptional regulator [Candidatus Polarisedimenticolaceae bacterium]
MPALQMTGLARIPLNLLAGAEQYELDRDELSAAAGLTPSELADPDTRVPLSKIWALWRVLIERTDDPALGLRLGMRTRVRELGLVGYAVRHSRTLREAIGRVARYSRIVNEALVLHLIENENHGKLIVERAPALDELIHPTDMRLASALAVAREITGAHIVPREVGVPHARPADVSAHERFFSCAIAFDQPESVLVFRCEDLDRAAIWADATLIGYLDRLADEMLASLDETVTFRERVRRAIWFDLSGGKPSVRQVARQLGVSPRTLQRRLEENDTSFAIELDRLRHEMAVRLLQDRSLAVYEVAFLLGYSEPSTFYRAFRRWERRSPQEYRRTVGDPADRR